MKQIRKTVPAALLAMTMLSTPALADTISFSGTVDVATTAEVYATIGGMVENVPLSVGEHVNRGDVIAKLKTTKVYASESGKITGVFGSVGDNADTVSSRYGAVMYIEGSSLYTISASTDNAYNSTKTKFVTVGEKVYLSCHSDSKHKGTGIITSVQGTSYTVEVRKGEFIVGESVDVYRNESRSSSTRIGRGDLSRNTPIAVNGSGSIVSVAVSDGQTVERGDLLFETLDGTFDGYYMSGTELLATSSGIISQLQVTQGSNVMKDSVIAVIYPDDAMRITAQVSESNLDSVKVGDPVSIELLWNEDYDVAYDGKVTAISSVANTANMDSGNVTYNVYIDFTPDENTRYGMTATVTTLDGEEAEDVEAEDETSEE